MQLTITINSSWPQAYAIRLLMVSCALIHAGIPDDIARDMAVRLVRAGGGMRP